MKTQFREITAIRKVMARKGTLVPRRWQRLLSDLPGMMNREELAVHISQFCSFKEPLILGKQFALDHQLLILRGGEG